MSKEPKGGCPCLYVKPCDPRCACVAPASSRGCSRCCKYGSLTQRKAAAQRLVASTEEEWQKYEALGRQQQEEGNAWLVKDAVERARHYSAELFDVLDVLNGKKFTPQTEIGKRVLALREAI